MISAMDVPAVCACFAVTFESFTVVRIKPVHVVVFSALSRAVGFTLPETSKPGSDHSEPVGADAALPRQEGGAVHGHPREPGVAGELDHHRGQR